MSKIRNLLLVAVLICVTSLAPIPAQASSVSYYGALHVRGAQLVDKNDHAVQLRGVSTHGIAWFPEYVNAKAVKSLKDTFHANVFRIACYTDEYGGYCNGGDKKSLEKTIDTGVKAAEKNDMYVIIDWHVLNEHPNPLDHKSAAKKFFKKMSKKYAKYDNVIYEICNEPNSGTSWSDIKKYAKAVIPVIRKNAPDSVVIVGTPTWSQDVDKAVQSPLTYKNVMYAFHFYAGTHHDDYRKKLTDAYKNGLPVFVSEFGTCDASGNGGFNKKESDTWIELLDSMNISYVNWSLCNKAETASIIKSSCKKTSGWKKSDLTKSGKWLYETLRKY
ncbi:MAG: glycoside hydrolase family 5 protein [Lachnospiraceae bacterium]|nr:glycoside hydrolase family 5 protein [Lachnospiraceae bacterium]